MAKSSNQKLKLIYLMKILLEKTDETHSITMSEIIDSLDAYNISAERKSLYNDIENLRVYGLDIIGEQQDRTFSYHVGNRQFELAELKLLVDSIQSAKFITAKKSNELIKKIEGFASKYEASQLDRLHLFPYTTLFRSRSEERRVGKECMRQRRLDAAKSGETCGNHVPH